MPFLVGPVFNFKHSPKPMSGGGMPSGKGKTDGRTIVGYASVFGNIDAASDIVLPTAFDNAIKLFKAGRSRAKLLWNHDSSQPPVGHILDLKKVGRDNLPAVMRENSAITGALEVTRRYFDDAFSDRVYNAVKSGAVNEMSFAFDVIKHSYGKVKETQVRFLEEMDIYDVSDVNFGCNAATMANVGKNFVILDQAKIEKMKKQRETERYLRDARARASEPSPEARRAIAAHNAPKSEREWREWLELKKRQSRWLEL